MRTRYGNSVSTLEATRTCNNSDFLDVEETAAHSQESPELHYNPTTETVGAGEFHGGYGSASLQESVERILSQEPTTSATCRSGEGLGPSSSNMTDPPQKR